MTDQEILEKAIQKAIDGGWATDYEIKSGIGICRKLKDSETYVADGTTKFDIIYNYEFAKSLWGEYKKAQYDTHDSVENDKDTPQLPSTYNSDQHFEWLDKYAVCSKCKKSVRTYDQRMSNCGDEPIVKGSMGWEYHLMRMVVSEDPIKYLSENM